MKRLQELHTLLSTSETTTTESVLYVYQPYSLATHMYEVYIHLGGSYRSHDELTAHKQRLKRFHCTGTFLLVKTFICV
jgi:hypothetical protein